MNKWNPFNLADTYENGAFFIPQNSSGLTRTAEATSEEVMEIQHALTDLWDVARSNIARNTMCRIRVVKGLNTVIKYLNEDKLNAFECKSLCELMMRFKLTFLEHANVKKALEENINMEKLFKKAFLAQRAYPNFKFKEFAETFRVFFGEVAELDRYTNML